MNKQKLNDIDKMLLSALRDYPNGLSGADLVFLTECPLCEIYPSLQRLEGWGKIGKKKQQKGRSIQTDYYFLEKGVKVKKKDRYELHYRKIYDDLPF